MIERELYHYGVRGMKWGVRNDDGSLSRLARERLVGYDDDFEDSESFRNHFYKAQEYSDKWQKKYGYAPVNRLRFEYDVTRDIRRGAEYCSDYGLADTSLEKIYDSYNEYRESEDWG